MNSQKVDYIIVGQGIAGILMSYELISQGATCLVFDNENIYSSSQHAGALLNPVNLNTAKTFPSQEADFKIALWTYEALEQFLSVSILKPLQLFIFTEGVSRDALNANPKFQKITTEEVETLSFRFYNARNALSLAGVFKVNFLNLKTAWRTFLIGQQMYMGEEFDYSYCQFEGKKIRYQNIEAGKIIFCEGSKGKYNPFFQRLPFTDNCGNVLQLHIDGLSANQAYHFQGKKLIPLGKSKFWFGSNYQWNFKDLEPDTQWRKESITFLNSWLKLPFTLQQHFIAERPTTAGQRPLLLRHPSFPAYFFNGLGTRGFSRGPTLTKDMAQLCQTT